MFELKVEEAVCVMCVGVGGWPGGWARERTTTIRVLFGEFEPLGPVCDRRDRDG